ncbi:MAG: response regulator [Candidatus Aminicenantaceae bacterium]|jgi:DNA-binding NtrC family response regulator
MTETEKQILIIDPNHDERMVMASFLRSENYAVDTGSSLTDAIKMLSGNSISCLILDVDLPEMKGYEAVSILKNISPALKIIMTTKTNSRELEAKVREQDIFFYFIKSFSKDELKLAIHNALNK